MAATKGFDCAVPLTAAQAKALAAQGFAFAARYVVPAGYAWKRLTPREAAAIAAAGLRIVSVFETTASRPQGGAAAGRIDGAAAYREARAVGQPIGSAIYFAVDYDAQPQDFEAIASYLAAASEELPGYKVGVYGSYDVCEEMAKRQAAACIWQTYAWSRGRKSPHANMYQYENGAAVCGVALDLDEGFGNEGGWIPMEQSPPQSPNVTIDGAKVIVNDKLITEGDIEDGHLVTQLAAVLDACGIRYTWHNEQKKLYIYT